MNILIPVLAFGRGGGERVLARLADELIRLGHAVAFLCPEGSNKPYFPTMAPIWWAAADGTITNKHKVVDKTENALSIQRKLRKSLASISKNSYDVILANQSLTVLPIKRAGWAAKTLYYVQAYEPEFYLHFGGSKNRVLSEVSALTYTMNLFTVVNADIYHNYKKLTASRTLYPGVDKNIFHPIERIDNTGRTEKVIIGTVGRLENFKGTKYVLDAFLALKKKHPDTELHVAFGDPASYERYEGVHCFQPHGDEALANFYRSLDYYFCAGFIQLGAFHYPVVEAMCCGIPVITTPYYPANAGNAWVTQIKQIDSIVEQFEFAQSDKKERLKRVQQALEDTKQFDWKLVGERLDGYINELAGAGSPSRNKIISK